MACPCRTRELALKITFFVNSIIGYVDNPAAIYTRGLAHGLALRGNDIRVVEERQNAKLTRTLQATGSQAARHVYESFPLIQYNTFEPRTGARLLEWVTRELALIDVAVAVQGLGDELCRWIANVTRDNLTRAYLAWNPEDLTTERAAYLELDKYDLILATDQPRADIEWTPVRPTMATQDRSDSIDTALIGTLRDDLVDPVRAAELFEALVTRRSV